VDETVLKRWAIPVILGVVLGSAIARYAPADLFKVVFVLVAGFSAIRLLFARESWRLPGDLPMNWVMRLYGLVIGLLSALMGIGGGQLGSMLMTFHGRSIHQAVATSSGLGILISIPGALGYVLAGWPQAAAFPDVAAMQFPLAIGYVSLLGFVLFVPASIVTVPLGAKLAHALPKRQLEIAFGVFLLLVCGRFAASLLI
jgi:uncharacterized protein